ncbi:mitochondrial import receptor subunit Tom22 [Recurvomyces mirabilis]|uniref:Mitochondrial import receptor subunit Tom22 n=1 Tax=Recurvomyces mirabilis TaxID=574656 RepID=A0AAE0WX62_9PEZI|nr:mitochondrial import receptor subunit Tom22 [Recurvomyces mirabilis]KAK5162113.1 mitochondrial import receptor subunit Tom22 [Recurvomyces mirabilis]
MVKLEEVPDEELNAPQMGPKSDEDEWDTDDESETSSIASLDSDNLDETLFDRLAALQDIVPPTYRKSISNAASTGYSWAASAAGFSGTALWVVSTSALLLGVPWALAFSEEQQVQEMEREMRMQQNAQGMLTQGATGEAKPAL